MLQHLGSGDATFFVDVPDNEYRQSLFLGHPHDPHGALFDLAQTAGGGADLAVRHSLYGINDHNIRRNFVDGGDNVVQIRFCQHIGVAAVHAQTHGPQLQLAFTFFAGDIEDGFPCAQTAAHLQQQRGLADTRRTAHQIQRAYHRAAAQHPVKFRYTGDKADLGAGVQLGYALYRAAVPGRLEGGRALPPAVSAEFHFLQGVPCPTGRAFASPVGRLVAAGGAAINCLLFCHNILRLSGADEPCSILQIGSHQYR